MTERRSRYTVHGARESEVQCPVYCALCTVHCAPSTVHFHWSASGSRLPTPDYV